MAKVTMKQRKEKLAEVLEANAGAELTDELMAEIKGIFGGSGTSNKVNGKGEVHCNYFDVYLPAEEFAVSNKGKIDSMSKEGKRLYRTQKSMVNKATAEVLKQFRSKDITAAEMEELLSTIDANAGHRYPQGTEAIPTEYPFSV
jgi:tryptophanyl-tRNA synthetase